MAPKKQYKKTGRKAKITFRDLKSPSPEKEMAPPPSFTRDQIVLRSPSPEDHGTEATSTVEEPFMKMPLGSSSDDGSFYENIYDADSDDDSKTIRPSKTTKDDTEKGLGSTVKAPASDPPTSSGRRGLVGRTPPSHPL